jgi:hypothetical protein
LRMLFNKSKNKQSGGSHKITNTVVCREPGADRSESDIISKKEHPYSVLSFPLHHSSRDLLHHQERTQNKETVPSFLGRRILSVFRIGTELKCGSRKNANELKMTLDKNPLTWTCSRLVEPPAEHSRTPASARKIRADTNFTMVELFLANITDCDCATKHSKSSDCLTVCISFMESFVFWSWRERGERDVEAKRIEFVADLLLHCFAVFQAYLLTIATFQ